MGPTFFRQNRIPLPIERGTGLLAENEKGTKHLSDDLSLAAEREGFEPPDL